MTETFRAALREHAAALEALEALERDLLRVAELCIACIQSGGKLMFCGNGGSAADAQHLACELVGRYLMDGRAIPALALHGNASTLTAVGNDLGFEAVFEREIEALARPGDVLVCLSTSGQSPNVLRAALQAKASGARVIGLTGRTGGALREMCEICLCVPADRTPRIQEMHILLGHVLCEIIEREVRS